MMFVQRNNAGEILAADQRHFEINFPQKQYEFLCKAGMILQPSVTVQSQSDEIRVIVRDLGSGSVGSVTLPVKTFFPGEASPAPTTPVPK